MTLPEILLYVVIPFAVVQIVCGLSIVIIIGIFGDLYD